MTGEAISKSPTTQSQPPLPSLESLVSLSQTAPAQFADLSACNAQAESAKLEQAIKANLRGLGYGG